MLDTYARRIIAPTLSFLSKPFIEFGVTPVQVTVSALLVGLSAAALLALSYPLAALLLLWASGLLDCLDGELARATSQQTPRGAFLDIISDRVVEVAIIVAFSLNGNASDKALLVLACAIILSFSVFLSTGVLAPRKGVKAFFYQSGIMERTEGFILFSLMMLFPGYATLLAYLFTILVGITALQRFYWAWMLLR